MVADNSGPTAQQAQIVLNDFQKLGFKFNFRQVPHDTMYTKYCQVKKEEPPICPSVGWLKDFADPETLLDPVFNGKNILDVGNSNFAQLNDPKVNDLMDKAEVENNPAKRNQAWGEVDKAVTEAAPGVPWLWDKALGIESKNVRGVLNKFNAAWDLSYTSLR